MIIARSAIFGKMADCLSTPGVGFDAEITTLVQALGGKTINVLTVQPTMTVQHLEDLGVRRISVGGALARMAWAGFMQASQEIAGRGRLRLSRMGEGRGAE